MIKSYVWWSIYVQTATVQKLKSEHLPPIEQALGSFDFNWQILVEDETPLLFRLINYENNVTQTIEETIIPVLRRAYQLGQSWTISGLDDLNAGNIRHVFGARSRQKPSHRAPAIYSAMFEIEPGEVTGMDDEGAWNVVS